jgi:RND superfamily putative drug exporter
MLKLARWSTSHRGYVVVGWVLLLLVVGGVARGTGTSYSNDYTIPNSDAQRASDLLQQSFPQQAGDRDTVVFKVGSGSVRDRAVRAHMSAMFARLARLPHVASVISAYAPGQSNTISRDGRIAFATVVFDEKASNLPGAAAKRVVDVARAAARPGRASIQVELGGQAVSGTEDSGFGVSTAVGLVAAIVVLLMTFGSLVAMGLPIATALAGLGTGLGAITLFTHVIDTPDFSSELATMIGLGVGIDYALFVLTRFREAYRTPGPAYGNVREAVVQAMDTAGRAVLFAGCTVVIALLGMMLLGVNFLYGVALAASIGVLLVMLGSLTLLPALLTIVGHRVAGRGAPRRGAIAADDGGAAQTPAGAGRAWLRWSAFVRARPALIAGISTLVMLTIAAPAFALRLGSSDASSDPAAQTTHRAYDLLAEGFGQGFNGPLQVVAQLPSSGAGAPAGASAPTGAAAALQRLHAALAATPGVAEVSPAHTSPTGAVATITLYPRTSPQAYSTSRLVSRLRTSVIPPLAAAGGMNVYVGGVTAGSIDFASTLAQKLPLFIGVVVLVSALLLLVVFRSLVIPLQAAVMNLLGIGASLGVIVAIFQWGWLGGVMGVHKGPIESFIPVMLFAIVFGLSMDYEVFLVSRIHERWTHTRENSRAVAEGLALTGRVVTAAAAIMVCVFLSFMLGEDRVIREFGLSLSTAVFLDAVVVRCLLLPATMQLLGDRTWHLPAWLDRSLPQLNVEGTSLKRLRRAPGAAGAAVGARLRPRPRPGVAAEGADG